MKELLKVPVVLIGLGVIGLITETYSAPAKTYPLRLQPEIDVVDIGAYLRNDRLVRLQVKCVLEDDAPCDIVGRWAKPRVQAGLLGECLMCTEVQKGWLDTWLKVLVDRFPDLYRASLAKFVQNNGIKLSEEEANKTDQVLSKVDKLLEDGAGPAIIDSVRQNLTTTEQ